MPAVDVRPALLASATRQIDEAPTLDAATRAYARGIAVDPDMQGRGIGRQLYAAFVQRIQKRGGRQVRIETSSKESYGATGGYYERLGFSIDGRLRDFYAEGDDLLIFYRRLA